jgi:hypothetical protein
MKQHFTEEEIMAYADGVLEPTRGVELERSSRESKDLRARIELYRRTADMARSAFAGRPAEVNDALRANIDGMLARHEAKSPTSNVVRFPTRQTKPTWLVPSAIAASIALLIGFGAANFRTSVTDDLRISLGPLGTREINTALSRSLTGQTTEIGNGELAIIASFKDSGGHLCREFEVSATSRKPDIAVACYHGGRWETLFVVAGTSSEDIYSPASSTQTVDAFLQSVGAANALSENEERDALLPLRK